MNMRSKRTDEIRKSRRLYRGNVPVNREQDRKVYGQQNHIYEVQRRRHKLEKATVVILIQSIRKTNNKKSISQEITKKRRNLKTTRVKTAVLNVLIKNILTPKVSYSQGKTMVIYVTTKDNRNSKREEIQELLNENHESVKREMVAIRREGFLIDSKRLNESIEQLRKQSIEEKKVVEEIIRDEISKIILTPRIRSYSVFVERRDKKSKEEKREREKRR